MPKTMSLLILLLTLTLGLAPACSDDAEPGADKGPPVGDLYQPPPDAPLPDSEPPCIDGKKRCDGLFKIERCQGGVWVHHLDCSQKKIGGQTCKCSMTLMYVCSVGANECT